MQKILEVTEVRVASLRILPQQDQISATGTVSSSGWSNPQLIPYTYIQPPPMGFMISILSQIRLQNLWLK